MPRTALAVGGDIPIELVEGKAPTELRLFRAGTNPSVKGDWLFDDKAAQQVMTSYRTMGRDWVIADYDHGSLQQQPVDPSRSGRAAARRAKLELRDGELWATGIQWTPDAKLAIEAGEWPSISPAFEFDQDRRPTWVINFGLTGNPALHGPAEIAVTNALLATLSVARWAALSTRRLKALSAATEYGAQNGTPLVLRAIETIPDLADHPSLTAPLSFTYDNPAEVGGWRGGIEDDQETWILFVDTAGECLLWTSRDDDGSIQGDPIRVRRPDLALQKKPAVPLLDSPQPIPVTATGAREALAQKKDTKMRTAAETAAFFEITEEEGQMVLDYIATLGVVDVAAASAPTKEIDYTKEVMAANVIGLSIGLGPKSGLSAVVGRVAALNTFEREVLKATGTKSPSAALGAISGLEATKTLAQAQAKTIAELNAAKVDTEVCALLNTARGEKKLTPAEYANRDEDSLYATAMAKGDRATSWLSAHLKQRVPITALSTSYEEPKTRPADPATATTVALEGKTWATLSNVEKHELRATNPTAYKALADEHARQHPETARTFTHLSAGRLAPL